MASKGQKFRKYTKEFKEQVLKEYYEGTGGYKSLSEKYDMPKETIKTWVDKINNPQRFIRTGGKRGRIKDSETDWKEKYEILKKYQTFLKAQRERK